jgi:hypothetical protein
VLLADVPLELRCAAAVECVWRDATLGTRKRAELLAAALWPAGYAPGGEFADPEEPTE